MKELSLFLIVLFFWAEIGPAQANSHSNDTKNVLFLLDCCQGMGHSLIKSQPGNGFEASQQWIEKTVQLVSPKCSVGLRTFGNGNNCETTDLKIPLTKNKAKFINELMNLSVSHFAQRNTMTALNNALENDLASHSEENQVIVFISGDNNKCDSTSGYAELLNKHSNDHLWVISVIIPNDHLQHFRAKFLKDEAQLAKQMGYKNYTIADQSTFLEEFSKALNSPQAK